MALTLTEDETMLVDSVRGLLSRAAPVSAFRALRASGSALRYDPALYAELAGAGFVAPHVSEADGGLGMGATAAGLIAEQTGHTLAAAPLLSAAMAATLVVQAGSPAQKAEIVPQIIAGELVVAIAFEETARHTRDVLATSAKSKGDGWSLDGKKVRVIDAVGAKLLIVSAKTGSETGLFLVDPSGPGVEVAALPNPIDSRNGANVTLSGAPAERLGGGDASAAIAASLDLAAALIAAEQLGVADEAFTRTIAYIKEREQFDRKIGSFQALQHRAARLYARLELGRGIVLKALRALDENDPQKTAYATLAKGYVGKLARDVTVEAVQMHGGIGVTDDVDIGFFLKRARALNDLYGDDYFHAEKLAREHLGI